MCLIKKCSSCQQIKPEANFTQRAKVKEQIPFAKLASTIIAKPGG
jgi:hypothetical protein